MSAPKRQPSRKPAKPRRVVITGAVITATVILAEPTRAITELTDGFGFEPALGSAPGAYTRPVGDGQ